MKQAPYIWTESQIGRDGLQYIVIAVNGSSLNGVGIINGGRYIHFDLDYREQTTKAFEFTFFNGFPRVTKENVGIWKDEILAASEMLEFSKQFA